LKFAENGGKVCLIYLDYPKRVGDGNDLPFLHIFICGFVHLFFKDARNPKIYVKETSKIKELYKTLHGASWEVKQAK